MHDQQQNRLFALPSELRNEIYEMCLKSDSTTIPLFGAAALFLKTHKPLLYTCKRIAHEASGIYVSAYRIYWRDTTYTSDPYETIGLSRRLAGVSDQDITNISRLAFKIHVGIVLIIRKESTSPHSAYTFDVEGYRARPELRNAILTHPTAGPQRILELELARGARTGTPFMSLLAALANEWS